MYENFRFIAVQNLSVQECFFLPDVVAAVIGFVIFYNCNHTYMQKVELKET